MTELPRFDRPDACVIGAGASGAVAAMALAQSGLRVTVLERGPWLRSEDFAADELATLNRGFLSPDPRLTPRTLRADESERAHPVVFSNVPQLVGGGTVHWTGWVPRFQESDFRQHTLHGDVAGADLADWPFDYEALESYYDRVEWTLGVSGRAGANRQEAPRRRDYPCPPFPLAPYSRRFADGCEALGLGWFPTPTAMLSQPHGGRPRTVLSAFTERHGDPTGTKSTALTTFIPAALATGRVDLRPDSYVHALRTGARGRVGAVEYVDGDDRPHALEADVFVLACGAIESARLWLLSGLPNTGDLVGRHLTLHEFGGAIATFEDPVRGWVGGGHIGASTFDDYETDPDRSFIGGCHIFATGARAPWPINFTLPDAPRWGAAAKAADRAAFNHTMGAGSLLHDLPQAANRVDLDDEVRDAWGLPAARITHRMHANDTAQAEWFARRCAEILDAAGATRSWSFTYDQLTGNASHQHGTLRMGADAASSVLDADGRAYEVPNLFAVDGSGFPTASGINPTLTIMANAWRVCDRLVAVDRAGADRLVARA